jgi:drug/metabolite transporter (DMT)-like permease
MGFGFAARHLPAGALTIFNATTPLWGGLIGWIWYREHLSLRQLAGLLLGVAGVAVLMKDRAAMPQADLVSFACALVAPLSSAMAVHFSRRRLAHVNPLTNTVGTLLASSVLLVPIAVWQGPQPLHGAIAGAAAGWTQLSTLVWASVGALGLLCTGYAYLLFYRLLRNIGPQRTLSVAFLIPVFGMTWGALWLDEPVTLGMMAAAAVIMSGTWLSTTSPKPS